MTGQREFDKKQFESLCGMQCSVEELCGWFGCDEAALNTWCMDTYGEDFRSAFDRLAMMGRIVLRREQVAAAKKNVSMARHLEAQRAGHEAPPQKRKNYRLTDAYKELRQSMLQNLIDRDLDGDVYRDKVQEYMDFWVRRQELRDDIARRGLTVTDDRGRHVLRVEHAADHRHQCVLLGTGAGIIGLDNLDIAQNLCGDLTAHRRHRPGRQPPERPP